MSRFVRDPGNLHSLQKEFLSGTSDPVQLVESLLRRVTEVDAYVRAWLSLDTDDVLAQAEQCRKEILAGRHRGPLHGIPVAIKDVIDVAGLPTRAHSKSRLGARPAAIDSSIVSQLRTAGAIIMGKVHTTEYAYFDGPPPTRNPWRTTHTPGGSSAGSAAAVAAGMVPCSIGTQTAGSVVRPAAYCGIAAFKPTTQCLSTFGMVPLAPSFDTVGWFAYRMSDVAAFSQALQPTCHRAAAYHELPMRIAIAEDELLDQADDAVKTNMQEVFEKLKACGHHVATERAPVSFQSLIDWHRIVLEYELSRIHGSLEFTHPREVAPGLLSAIRRGRVIDAAKYLDAKYNIHRAQHTCWKAWINYHALVIPAAPSEAPEGMPTGDPRYIIPMTALGGPICTIPTGLSTRGLPLGVMVCGCPYSDGELIARSLRLADAIEMPRKTAGA